MMHDSLFGGMPQKLSPDSYLDVQRLFSTFPNSWPGFGLLVLRFATGVSLVTAAQVAADLAGTPSWVAHCVVGGVATLICIGLWTPTAAIIAAVIQILVIIVGRQFDVSLLVFAATGASLAMLGPGAWSVDARLFGRKRIL